MTTEQKQTAAAALNSICAIRRDEYGQTVVELANDRN
jgi:hypothetical protein